MDPRAEAILDYWLGEVGQDRWYVADAALDQTIRERFLPLWEEARAGRLQHWTTRARNALAFIILLDQFPRNMFRGEGRAFATDRLALAAAKGAIAQGFDDQVALPERQFFYLPLMHSEILADQDRCVRLFALAFGPGEGLDHARAHREVIRRFGRFPYRNAALGRSSTEAERAFLAAGGYESVLVAIRGA
jgi:uncharacterized protein (DUF924 family)